MNTRAESSPVLVLAAHGTCDPAGPSVFGELATLVRGRLPGVRVAVAFVDVIGPTLKEVLTEVLDRQPRAVVVPVFLGTGYHVETDIPGVAAPRGDRVVVTPALGPAPEIIRAVADRLTEARVSGSPARQPARIADAQHARLPDAVVLAAAGSTRGRSREQTHAAARALAVVLERPVTVGFVTAADPTVREAVWHARRGSGAATVGVAAYLLAPGTFHHRLHLAGADRVAAPIGAHSNLAQLVVRRFSAARRPADAPVQQRRPARGNWPTSPA